MVMNVTFGEQQAVPLEVTASGNITLKAKALTENPGKNEKLMSDWVHGEPGLLKKNVSTFV